MQTTDRRGILLLAAGHTITDINQGAVPALLPFFVVERGLSYTAASGLLLAATLLSSFVQPALGYFSDRRPMPWLMPLGILCAGVGLGFAGLAPTYFLVVAGILFCGLGVATFHPEAFRFANYVSGRRRATGIGVFSVGGSLGFALGPILATAAVVAFGLPGTMLLILPPALMAFVLWRELPRLETFRPTLPPAAPPAGRSGRRSMRGAFALLSVVIVLRSAMAYGVLAFAPLFLVNVRHTSIPEANAALTLFSLANALGALTGGALADRWGRKLVLIGSLLLTAPALAGLLVTSGALALFCIAVTGFATGGNSNLGIVMGQEYAPHRLGVATGITTGLAIGLGGVFTPLLGALADQAGLTPVFYVLILMPLIAAGITVLLPTARAVEEPTAA